MELVDVPSVLRSAKNPIEVEFVSINLQKRHLNLFKVLLFVWNLGIENERGIISFFFLNPGLILFIETFA